MNLTRWLATAGAALLVLTTTPGCSPASPADNSDSDDETVTVGIIGISSDAAITMGQRHGFFEDRGITVETTVVANPSAGLAAAQSGKLDVVYAPSISTLNALSQSFPLTVLAAADGYPKTSPTADSEQAEDATGLFTAPDSDIKRPRDLSGRTISVPARRAQLEVTIASAIKEDGGDPDTVNWMVLDPASALNALHQGRVDASGLVSPFTVKAARDGAHFLTAPALEFFGHGAVGLWLSGDSTVSEKPEQIRAFVDGIAESNGYANRHRDEAQRVTSEITKIDLSIVRQDATTYWPQSVTLDDLQRTNRKLASLGYLTEEVPLDDNIIYRAH